MTLCLAWSNDFQCISKFVDLLLIPGASSINILECRRMFLFWLYVISIFCIFLTAFCDRLCLTQPDVIMSWYWGDYLHRQHLFETNLKLFEKLLYLYLLEEWVSEEKTQRVGGPLLSLLKALDYLRINDWPRVSGAETETSGLIPYLLKISPPSKII